MKRKCYGNCRREIAAVSEKCDQIIELLELVLDSPDFLIERLRASVERQHRDAVMKPKMKLVRNDAR